MKEQYYGLKVRYPDSLVLVKNGINCKIKSHKYFKVKKS